MRVSTTGLALFVGSLLPTSLALPEAVKRRADIQKAGSYCDSKFKGDTYPISPELAFAIEVVPVSEKEMFHNQQVFVGMEKVLNPVQPPLEYIANPWEYSFTRQGAFNLHANGTLMMDTVWCDLVQETWFGESQIPCCPALSTLHRPSNAWEVKSRCVNNVIRLLLVHGKGKEAWRVAREENPGHELKQRIHWGKMDKNSPQTEVYLVVSVF